MKDAFKTTEKVFPFPLGKVNYAKILIKAFSFELRQHSGSSWHMNVNILGR